MRKAMQLFGVLNDLDVSWIGQVGTVQTLAPGQLLIQERVAIRSLYIVLEGQLSVFLQGASETEVAKLQSGEVVGEISFVDPRPPLASVKALQTSMVLTLDRGILNERLQDDDAFAARFYRAIASFLASRLYVTTSRLGYGAARQDADPDELPDTQVEEASMGALRFDTLIKQVRGDVDSLWNQKTT